MEYGSGFVNRRGGHEFREGQFTCFCPIGLTVSKPFLLSVSFSILAVSFHVVPLGSAGLRPRVTSQVTSGLGDCWKSSCLRSNRIHIHQRQERKGTTIVA